MAKRGLPLLILIGAALLSAPPPTEAQAAQPLPSNDTTIDELLVQPTASCLQPRNDAQAAPPRVVSTFPANGAVVRPGVLVLRVTFDQPMSCKGFFAAAAQARSPCPTDTQAWVLSYDRRTIRTVCRTEAASQYGLRISDRTMDADSKLTFVSLAGKRLAPYVLSFGTSTEAWVNSLGESMALDLEMREPEKDVPLKVQEFRGKR